MKMRFKVLLFVAVLVGISGTAEELSAQNRYDALRYSLRYPGQDPSTLAIPGASASRFQGSGSYIFNPAAMGLNKDSRLNGGLDFRRVAESVAYNGTTNEPTDQQTGISHLNFTYSFPTSRGSFVIGGGYHQLADFNRMVSGNVYNENTTVTDMFNEDDFYYDPAFNTFAVDYPDTTSDNTLPFMRINGYRGVQQDITTTERGKLGEWSAYVATEFKKDLFIGASIGIPSGSYDYERTILETDTRDFYEIRDVLSEDKINADISGFIARLGFIYKYEELLKLGVSYTFQSTMSIEEEYETRISTEFDTPDSDGNYNYSDSFDGNVNYNITRPDRIVTGITITPIAKLSISGTAEYIDYTSIDLDDLDARLENREKKDIENEFASVANLMGGVEYQISPVLSIQAGYGYYPSPSSELDSDRTFISGGFSYGLWSESRLNVGAQYGTWDDSSQLYSSSYGSEVMSEEVKRLRIMAGVSFGF